MHFAAGPQARWLGASDEHTLRYVRSEQQRQRACGPQPVRGAAVWGHLLCCRSLTMSTHLLRRGALQLPPQRSRQSA